MILGNPTEDPHGDPIPDAAGRIVKIEKALLLNPE
jgi:DtxR family Mn-dependent transcriptional regulator